MNLCDIVVAIKGAGDIASGIAHRLHRANIRKLYLMEIENPLAIRRAVSFSEAVYDGEKVVEGVTAVHVTSIDDFPMVWHLGKLPVLIDPEWRSVSNLSPDVIVDAILAKRNLGSHVSDAPLVIGLGPGFKAPHDVHRVLETQRGHYFGRVIDKGSAEKDTGIPGRIAGYTTERVLRAPISGTFISQKQLGDQVNVGEAAARVNGIDVTASIGGVIRGLLRTGTKVPIGMKVGDIDPRGVVSYCHTISDKARSLGGAVLEAVLEHFNC